MANRILHIILAVSVFFSTTGLIVVQHYCKEELKSIGLFVEAGCCVPDLTKKIKCCKLPKEEGGKGCCDTKAQYIYSDFSTFAIAEKEIALEGFDYLISPLVVTSFNPFQFSTFNFPFQYYQPPKIVSDLPVLFQSFLC